MSAKIRVKTLARTALFTALIVVGGFIRIPIGAVPITLQTIFVLLNGALCGKKVGFLAPLIYLLLGLVGLPIFSAGGGIAYVLYPTFGYIVGFVFAGFIAGIPKKCGVAKRIIFNLLGVSVIHVVGVLYFYFMSNAYLQVADVMYTQIANAPVYSGAEISLWQAILTGSLVFLPVDIISAIISALTAQKLYPIINK